jgi:alpha-mannosidase
MDGILGISISRYPAYPDPFTENIVENEYYIHVSETNTDPYLLMSKILKKPIAVSMNIGNIPLDTPLIDIHPETVAVESIKVAENKKGIIIRIFETAGKQSDVEIKTSFKYELYESDLIETSMRKLDKIKIMPFQIKTIFFGIR